MNKYKTFEELKEELGNKFDVFMYGANMNLLEKLEAYENMKKEAIEYVKWQRDNPQYDNVWRNSECESLLNILNKVGEDNENR